MIYHRCKQCSVLLTETNWNQSQRNHDSYLCKECTKEISRTYLAKHAEQKSRSSHEYYLKNKERIKARILVYKRGLSEKCKKIVFSHYGNGKIECNCCGETTLGFLTIDHIHGGGRIQSKSIGRGVIFYNWLINSNFPEGYQVLCMNCNWGKDKNGGICPHKAVK